MTAKERFLSLDVFRGLTVFLMIMVNTPGPGAPPFAMLEHANWFGFTLADLVFPSFLFAVGNAMSFSIQKFEGEHEFLEKVVKRTALIFLIGFLMYWFPFVEFDPSGNLVFRPFSGTRVMGVLQRIALCYGFGAIIVRYLSEKQAVLVSVTLLLVYWAILYLFGTEGQELSKLGNAGTLLDLALLGENHVYHGDEGDAFDPEGILSTLPAIVNVVAGFLVGVFMHRKGKTYESVAKMMMMGVLILLSGVSWGAVFPIAKKLWTSSFVLYTIGLDILILACLVYAVEMKGFTKGINFLNVFGKNPLFIYLLSEVLIISIATFHYGSGPNAYEWIGINVFQQLAPGSLGSLLCAIAYTMICWLAGFWLDRKRIYIKI